MHLILQPPRKKITVTKDLPSVNVQDLSISRDDKGEVHIYANPSDQVVVHRPGHGPGKVQVIYRHRSVHILTETGAKVAVHRGAGRHQVGDESGVHEEEETVHGLAYCARTSLRLLSAWLFDKWGTLKSL